MSLKMFYDERLVKFCYSCLNADSDYCAVCDFNTDTPTEYVETIVKKDDPDV